MNRKIVAIIFYFCFIASCEEKKVEVSNEKSVEVTDTENQFSHQFMRDDSLTIGYAYAEMLNDSLFTYILITKEKTISSDTLYYVDKYGGSYSKGIIDFQVGEVVYNDFFGIKVLAWKGDYLYVSYVIAGGNRELNDLLIEWNEDKKRFEKFRTP